MRLVIVPILLILCCCSGCDLSDSNKDVKIIIKDVGGQINYCSEDVVGQGNTIFRNVYWLQLWCNFGTDGEVCSGTITECNFTLKNSFYSSNNFDGNMWGWNKKNREFDFVVDGANENDITFSKYTKSDPLGRPYPKEVFVRLTVLDNNGNQYIMNGKGSFINDL